jgi:outer membrane lipopolysaccharide assembly protein LptE/RlpB
MSRLSVSRAILRAALVLTVAAGGCGYTLQGNLPDHLKTVSVPVFKNRTTASGAESTVTAAVINAFTTNGRLKVVSLDQADCILDGELTGYQVQSLTYDSRLNLRSYSLTVTMNVRFRDLRRTELLWQQDSLVESVSFDVAGQVADTISREEGAVKQAALEIGRKIVNRAVDRF